MSVTKYKNLSFSRKEFEDFVFNIAIDSSPVDFQSPKSDRSKYFDTSFQISLEDQKSMHTALKDHLSRYVDNFIEREGILRGYWDPGYITLVATQTMLATFMLAKFGMEDLSVKMSKRILKNATSSLFNDHSIDLIVAGGIADLLEAADDLYQFSVDVGLRAGRVK